MQNKTSKAKLDAALGIAPDRSIDEFLDSLTIDNDSAKEAVDKIDSTIKNEVAAIDKKISSIQTIDDYAQQAMSLVEIKKSLGNIDELISISKEIIKHIYECVVSTELVDSEMVHAAATLIESCHLNIKEYLDLYKDRLKFCDKLQFEFLKHKHNMELLEQKHKYDLEKASVSQNVVDVEAGNVVYDHDAITKLLRDQNL